MNAAAADTAWHTVLQQKNFFNKHKEYTLKQCYVQYRKHNQ